MSDKDVMWEFGNYLIKRAREEANKMPEFEYISDDWIGFVGWNVNLQGWAVTLFAYAPGDPRVLVWYDIKTEKTHTRLLTVEESNRIEERLNYGPGRRTEVHSEGSVRPGRQASPEAGGA
jgi:hypothetical protein